MDEAAPVPVEVPRPAVQPLDLGALAGDPVLSELVCPPPPDTVRCAHHTSLGHVLSRHCTALVPCCCTDCCDAGLAHINAGGLAHLQRTPPGAQRRSAGSYITDLPLRLLPDAPHVDGRRFERGGVQMATLTEAKEDKEIRDKVGTAGLIPLLVQLLDSKEEAVVLHVCRTLFHLARSKVPPHIPFTHVLPPSPLKVLVAFSQCISQVEPERLMGMVWSRRIGCSSSMRKACCACCTC